jgi:hypothetical protein
LHLPNKKPTLRTCLSRSKWPGRSPERIQ